MAAPSKKLSEIAIQLPVVEDYPGALPPYHPQIVKFVHLISISRPSRRGEALVRLNPVYHPK